MGYSSLNLIQVKGGRIIKQSDRSTPFSFVLIDSVGNEIPLNGKKALVSLRNPLAKTYWETTVTVSDSTVEFKMPGNLLDDKYILEISCDGYVFPSDNNYIINVKKGYAELVDGETATLYKQTVNELVREEAERAVKELGKTELKGDKGDRGLKGEPGKSITITNTTKQGKDNIITFSDNTTITVKDGLDGKDGKTGPIGPKGERGLKGDKGEPFTYDDLTEEQRKSLQVPVVDDLITGGSDKALSAEQGKKLFNTIVKYHSDATPPKVMTAVIDQANSNPLTCITYEDDAKMMEKGSPEWDDFFQSQLVLFKDGKEVRELEDSELSGLSPSDGDVMVRFPRKGLRIKTVGEKVYVSMTNSPNYPDFKYYAHSRGDSPRDAFYLGAYLGYEENSKLRSIAGKASTGNKTIGDFRTIAQANGTGYEQLAFYQWTFLQAMYVLKYGNLDSRTALGKGNTSGSNYDKATGETNGKGIDFGNSDDKTKVRFQWIEDFFGTKTQWLDGFKLNTTSEAFASNSDFSNSPTKYNIIDISTFPKGSGSYPKKIIGTNEGGFLAKEGGASNSTHYCDYNYITSTPSNNPFARVGGSAGSGANAGAFFFRALYSASYSSSYFGARLMFL